MRRGGGAGLRECHRTGTGKQRAGCLDRRTKEKGGNALWKIFDNVLPGVKRLFF